MLLVLSFTNTCAKLYAILHETIFQFCNLSCSVSTFSRSVIFHVIVVFSCVFILTELCGFVTCTLRKISKTSKTYKISKTSKTSKFCKTSKIFKITEHEIVALEVDEYGKIDSLHGLGECITSQKYKSQ